MKYIDYEDGEQGTGWYVHEGGACWEARPEEVSLAFGSLPLSLEVWRNGYKVDWFIRQQRKNGIPYWAPHITKDNLDFYLDFLGEDKLIQTLQVAANQLGQDLTISQEVRSADWMKCDEEAITSRLSRLSARDPDTLISLRSEMMELMVKKATCTSEEEKKKIEGLLLENIEKQAKKVKAL